MKISSRPTIMRKERTHLLKAEMEEKLPVEKLPIPGPALLTEVAANPRDASSGNALHDMLWDDLPAGAQRDDGLRVCVSLELVEHVLDEDHEAPHLEAAAGGAGAPGHDDEEEGDDGKEGTPTGEIDGEETGGRNERSDVEEGVAEG